MNIIILIISLAALILIHEFGHFIAAKWSCVRVDEFGIGFPPKLFGKKYGETEYTVNLIPFGGFVRIFGENPDDESLSGPDKDRSFSNKPKARQALIIAAGVLCNLLLGWVLISLGFMSGMPVPVSSAPKGVSVEGVRIMVTSVEEGSPAEKAGLKAGDPLVSLRTSDDSLRFPELSITGIQNFIAEHGGESVFLMIEIPSPEPREYTEIQVVPQAGVFGDTPAIGISMDEIGVVSLSPLRALWEGALMTGGIAVSVAYAFFSLIADALTGNADLAHLTGPVGIVGLIGDAAGFGFVYLLSFIAFISVNLAVLNVLPIPALDGGRLFFLAIEAVKGSRLSPRIVNAAHLAGFAVLIVFMLLVTYNDIVHLVSK